MSHTVSVTGVKITNITALKAAAVALGLTVKENAVPRFYAGAEVAPYVIKLPGSYDVGVYHNADGTFQLATDYYLGSVEKSVGKNCQKLLQGYSAEVLRQQAIQSGMGFTTRTLDNGNIEVIMEEF